MNNFNNKLINNDNKDNKLIDDIISKKLIINDNK